LTAYPVSNIGLTSTRLTGKSFLRLKPLHYDEKRPPFCFTDAFQALNSPSSWIP